MILDIFNVQLFGAMIEIVFTILLSSLLGAIIRFSLTYADQRWLLHINALTCMLLPPITFVTN